MNTFKGNEAKNLTLFFKENKDKIHPDIFNKVAKLVEAGSLTWNAAELFFERLTDLGLVMSLEFTGLLKSPEDIVDCVGMTTRKIGDVTLETSIENDIYYILVQQVIETSKLYTSTPHLQAKILKGRSNEVVYNIIKGINDINGALAIGWEAWVDAIYLYFYNYIKTLKCTLAKNVSSGLVRTTLNNVPLSKKTVIFYNNNCTLTYMDIFALLTGEELVTRSQFKSRLDAIAYERKISKAMAKVHETANMLKVKYTLD